MTGWKENNNKVEDNDVANQKDQWKIVNEETLFSGRYPLITKYQDMSFERTPSHNYCNSIIKSDINNPPEET
jgi:hypothetical protein